MAERAERVRIRGIVVTGLLIGLTTGLVVGLVGKWLQFPPALTSGIIAAVTSATITSLYLQSRKKSP
jgi:Kef-type K+ transport system membrane component KefB